MFTSLTSKSQVAKAILAISLLTSLKSIAGLNTPISVTDYKAPIRVACVGDSITFGSGLPKPAVDSYPAQLNRMLDGKWDVHNYGVSGATLLNAGDRPYQQQPAFKEALGFKPDVVIVMLGANDSKPQNWRFNHQFASDYKGLIEKFSALDSKPKIFICLPTPVLGNGSYNINSAGVRQERPMIERVAKEENTGLIDMHAVFAGKDALIPDHVHPNAIGAAIIAKTVYKVLTGKDFNEDVPAVKRQ